MASYFLKFKCNRCGEVAVSSILGLPARKQDDVFEREGRHRASCNNGHESAYFLSKSIEVLRTLSSVERQNTPELLRDIRFFDIA
jgi:hypothetical protein